MATRDESAETPATTRGSRGGVGRRLSTETGQAVKTTVRAVDHAPQAQKVETHGDPRAISRSVVGILKEHLGRGPVKAKTYLHEDSVLVLMYNGHTQAEETLQEADEDEAVAASRVKASEAIREPLVAVIESETGRTVAGYMSSSQQEPSLLSLVFVLDSSDLLDEDAPKA